MVCFKWFVKIELDSPEGVRTNISCMNCLLWPVLYAILPLTDLYFFDLLCYMMYISVELKAKNDNFAVINTIVKHKSYEKI